MPDEMECTEDEMCAGATVTLDDGCDWTAWHVWNMRSRFRMRKGIFEHPPARPQIVKVAVKQKRKPRKRRKISIFSDDF